MREKIKQRPGEEKGERSPVPRSPASSLSPGSDAMEKAEGAGVQEQEDVTQ